MHEESPGGGGRLDLCEGSPGVDNQHISRHDSPSRAETSRANPADRHPGHTTPHRARGSGAIGGQAPIHAPRGARSGSPSVPYTEHLDTGGGR